MDALDPVDAGPGHLLAHYALVYTRSWAANSSTARVRLAAKADRLEQEIALSPKIGDSNSRAGRFR